MWGEYMLIYAGTKSDFMIDTENDRLETKLYENIKLPFTSASSPAGSPTCRRFPVLLSRTQKWGWSCCVRRASTSPSLSPVCKQTRHTRRFDGVRAASTWETSRSNRYAVVIDAPFRPPDFGGHFVHPRGAGPWGPAHRRVLDSPENVNSQDFQNMWRGFRTSVLSVVEGRGTCVRYPG